LLMLRFLFLFGLFFTLSSFAKDISNKENVQILAKNLNHKGDIVRASGDVLVFSPSYYITAKELIYNKKNKTLELFNNVNILKDNKLLSVTDYAFIDFKNDTSLNKPILMLDKETNLWINAAQSRQEQTLHSFDSATLSSCDCDSPFWSIGFSSGDYDTEEKWVNTYNSRLYVGPVPIFYTPWFGFSTDNQRRSGLLQPTVGYDKSEGLLYTQPIFIAPKANWDIEFTPQIRARRGSGLYANFRYKDTENSYLKLKTGYFREQSDFKDENNIENISHYGLDIDYYNTKLLSKGDDQDGLSIKLSGLNDIGYRSLENTSDSIYNISNNIITSEIDYFYNTNKYFGYTEFKYFKDVSANADQDSILQQLPKIKLHSYSKEIKNTGILYSADLTYMNEIRNTGVSANTYNVNVPLSYNFSMLDDFINVNLQEQIGASLIKYSNTNTYNDATFLENKHIINISTDLIKPYKDYLHTFNLQSTITIPNIIKEDGDIYFNDNDDINLKPFSQTKAKEHVTFKLNHSFYSKDSLQQIINHKIDQSINYKASGDDRLSDLGNELIYYYAYGQISNKLTYNHANSTIESSSTSFKFNHNDISLSLSHTDTQNLEALNFTVSSKFNRYYTLQYKENYNLDDSISNIREYSLYINKRCWGLNIKLADNLVAAPTTSSNAIRQNIIYFLFTMKPIGQFQQQYVIDDTQGN